MDLKELKITSEVNQRHPWESARIEVVYTLLKSFNPQLLTREATILDVGCGDIFLIEELSRKIPQWKFFAVDTAFNDELLLYYNRKHKGRSIKVFNSLETAYNQMDAAVDIVLLLDVIEHIENDIEFLSELKEGPKITEETLFFITVPAFQFLFCSHDVFLDHYRRYTNKSLSTHIQKAGLVPINMGYFFFSLLKLRTARVLIEKIFGNKEKKAKGIGGWKGNPILDGIVKRILMLDFKMGHFLHKAGIKLPGLSNYIVCKKRV